MFLLQLLSKLIKVLRAGESPGLIAGGLTLGFFLGLTPFGTLHSLIGLLVALLTKVNLAAVFWGMFVFSGVAYLVDPFFHDLGYFVLVEVSFLKELWTALYNMPVVPFTRFYNTVVMGSTLVALVLMAPVHVAARKGVEAYRARWADRLRKAKLVKAFKGSFVFKWYVRIRDLEW